ncbi:DUF4232 domain-containing protein [Streptomyces apocyni]|uniref:DUF4232 domain-containing protein n=1 Tax=Streptomyces apocyni TaxID=2654677 RepID=UPI0012E99DE3|nr:DUF4232 domain-containing protein [Streptomyces apocyni]
MRHTSSITLPAALPVALAGVLLLTACGTQPAGTPDPPVTPGASGGPGPSALPGDPADLEKDGVRITAIGDDARDSEFEVTNDASEPFTYTITFSLLSESGGALANPKQTVPSVKPGQTLRRTLTMGDSPSPRSAQATRVKILTVRRVPAAEAPSEGGPCPRSGLRVYAGRGDAAMGLRVVSLHLVNCGTRTERLNGYPRLELIDEDHKPVKDVQILEGGSTIATGTGTDGEPQPIELQPGEAASAGLTWRNTTEAGPAPVHAPYVRVRAKPGADPVMVTPELDLGTTGKLGVGPWKKNE